MLNELYTFAEPVQVVPFSSLKWGKFTLLHTHSNRDTQSEYLDRGVEFVSSQESQVTFHICLFMPST